MKVSAIVPAAGVGIRLQSSAIKPFIKLNGEPLIIHTLRAVARHPFINEIVVVFHAGHIHTLRALLEKKRIKKIKAIVEGGPTRTQSVNNGLRCLGSSDYVLIHDGARPFVQQKTITDVISAARRYGAAIAGIPATSTLKKINTTTRKVVSTLRRQEIWAIQTPQVFKKDILNRAYEKAHGIDAPDDAFLVERLGCRVAVVMGSALNIKITTPQDLFIARALMRNKKYFT